MTPRPPKQLLLAFLGEHVLDRHAEPLRASVLISVLEGAGVAAPASRATLDRMAARGLLVRQRRGRELLFELTDAARAVLREGGHRVHGLNPFDAVGPGWTLVTFSVPESLRTLRHRLRATLSWSGFGHLRDGLWIAPGEIDVTAMLEPLSAELPPHSVTAFRATEDDRFPLGDSVYDAWEVEAIRAQHLAFLDAWGAPGADDGAASPLSARTMLVADWLALLRADPRLPRAFLGDDWPSDRSLATYRARHFELAVASTEEFARRVAVDQRVAV